jgi:hypothetical protein
MGWQKKPQIPKSIQVDEKYSHQYVLPKLQDERMQAKLNLAVSIICVSITLLISWLVLHYGFHIFSRHWLWSMVGILLLGLFGVVAWFVGLRIAVKASEMRLQRYYDLYQNYLNDLEEVEEARAALMKAEQHLAGVEKSLDQLIANTGNRPAIVAGFAAISAVITETFQSRHHDLEDRAIKLDATDHAVYYHEQQVHQKEERRAREKEKQANYSADSHQEDQQHQEAQTMQEVQTMGDAMPDGDEELLHQEVDEEEEKMTSAEVPIIEADDLQVTDDQTQQLETTHTEQSEEEGEIHAKKEPDDQATSPS